MQTSISDRLSKLETNTDATDDPHFRKRPRQQRAEQTVARIMDATLALILETGYSTLTTNRIAQKSGVNIASLYQYFHNKQVIVQAIYERALAEYSTSLNLTIMAQMSKPIEVGIPKIVGEAFKFIASERKIFVDLLDEVPELRKSLASVSLEKLSFDVSHRYVKNYLQGMSSATIRLRTFSVQCTSMSLITRYIADQPAGISQPRFIEEVSRICVGILKG